MIKDKNRIKTKILHISDQRFWHDEQYWYTKNTTFPMKVIFKSWQIGEISEWTFFGRLGKVEKAPAGAIILADYGDTLIKFVGVPDFVGIKGYIKYFLFYLYTIEKAIKSSDLVILKANFIASWLALPFINQKHLFVSHQIGDPDGITTGHKVADKVIRKLGVVLTNYVIEKSHVNVFVSHDLKNRYGGRNSTEFVANETQLNLSDFNVKAASSNSSKLHILYVGRLSIEKDIQTLLFALSDLNIHWQLSLVGEGPEYENLQHLARQLNIIEHITFLGPIVWGKEVFEIMRRNDLLVLPSKTEGLGLVLVEAMSQGLPIIASNVGGIPEIVHDNITGLLFSPGDRKSLSEKILVYYNNSDFRETVAINGLLAANQHTIDKNLALMFCKLSNIIADKPPVKYAKKKYVIGNIVVLLVLLSVTYLTLNWNKHSQIKSI